MIVYEDGDSEEFDIVELRKCLLPEIANFTSSNECRSITSTSIRASSPQQSVISTVGITSCLQESHFSDDSESTQPQIPAEGQEYIAYSKRSVHARDISDESIRKVFFAQGSAVSIRGSDNNVTTTSKQRIVVPLVGSIKTPPDSPVSSPPDSPFTPSDDENGKPNKKRRSIPDLFSYKGSNVNGEITASRQSSINSLQLLFPKFGR